MSNYVKTEISEQFRTVAVEFDLEDNRIFELGERINTEYDVAYMNVITGLHFYGLILVFIVQAY
ncbi:hypothetical protein [Mannheimia haemolytica]|uniref:hypothetical protein n=1 Tax=Mannheimia haemolytica TaxID=75985 RepID=UPI000386A331|nr:hypothetical protein [Mannheimia haemolytica]EPY98942.1 hypothetical protein L278_02925 [Mannheimia haemolytica D35]MDW1149047.1 hypothetical protein [Mannheimia haemolytica]MDW1159133.1 hypothetical protein [Mannheimia haemolytica]MEE3700907.1 hypothetical protein [Mannheimia haemolytica]